MRPFGWKPEIYFTLIFFLYSHSYFSSSTKAKELSSDYKCSNGYKKATDQQLCYKVFSELVLWEDAINKCFNESSYLLQFQNDISTSNMSSIQIDKSIDYVWISLRRLSNYFQWIGMHPQLFISDTKAWGLHWKGTSEPKMWQSCAAVELKTGELRGKDCEKKKLPFVCVKPLEVDDIFDAPDTSSDQIEVSIVPIFNEDEKSPLTKSNILWVNKEEYKNITLICQVKINGKLINVQSEDSKTQIVWSKNGIHLHTPIKSSISPSIWINPTPWKVNIGRIENFLGSYTCEANIPYQTRRHPSNTISLFIRGILVFKYHVDFELDKKIKIQKVEPTSSAIFYEWNNEISQIADSILPIDKPHIVNATKIEWMVHYIKPLDEIEYSDGHWTKNVVISMFVAVKTQSKDYNTIKEKLLNYVRNYSVKIENIGKCPTTSEFDFRGTKYTWSMNIGQRVGFSNPVCVKSEPKYQIVSRQCKVSYEVTEKWDHFSYTECTSKFTHLFEDELCPKGYKISSISLDEDFCFTHGSTDSTWKIANDECIKKGGHLPYDIYDTIDMYSILPIPLTTWSMSRFNGYSVYPGLLPLNVCKQNWSECIVLNSGCESMSCEQKHPFICISRIQATLWNVPWCPRGGWLGSEISTLRNTCFFINYSMTVPKNLKSEYCREVNATVADTSNPLIYFLVSATIRKHQENKRIPMRKRSVKMDEFIDIPYLVCQKPKLSTSPRKGELVLKSNTQTKTITNYKKIELICHQVNIRPNSKIVWYHNGDPFPSVSPIEFYEANNIAAVDFVLHEDKQGDYWCKTWENIAQTTITSNKISLTLPDVINIVVIFNISNSGSPKTDAQEVSQKISKEDIANSECVEITLLPDNQLVLWMQSSFYQSDENMIIDVKPKLERFQKSVIVLSNSPPITVRSTEWCLNDTTTTNGSTLAWPKTKRGDISFPNQLCLTENGNAVSRHCIGDFRQGAYWGSFNGKCSTNHVNKFTESLYRLSKSMITGDNALNSSRSLDRLTESIATSAYKPVDIEYISKTMQKISDTGKVTDETLKNIVVTVDRVMNVDSDIILLSHESSRSSNRITQSLEKMIDSVPIKLEHPLQLSSSNLYVEAHQLTSQPDDIIVGVTSYNKQQTILTSASQLNYSQTDAALLLPLPLVEEQKQLSGNNGLKMYFVVYHNSKLFPTKNATVNSKVVAASFPNRSVQNCEPPIKLVFRPLKITSTESLSCKYWDSRLGNGNGDWSSAGCVLQSSQQDIIVCHCTHLTNFAVLMDVYGQESRIDGTHRQILDAITYIGCAFSIFGLSLTILTFLLFSKWRKKDGNKIVCNLAFALLFLLIIFLAGIEQTHSPVMCKAVAILMHYFILSAFCWMLVEAIQQYLLFVRVLATYIPRFILKSMLFAWGLPLIVVVTVIGIDIEQYNGGHHYCWMQMNGLYYSFILPIGIIMFINAIVFILVLRGITCGRRSNLRSTQTKQQLIKTQVYAAICIFFLLGLTWVFGFLAIGDARLIFQYFFCICNSIQGLLIFIFMVVRDRNAHDLWISLYSTKKVSRTLRTTSGIQARRNEGNSSENCTTKYMISRT